MKFIKDKLRDLDNSKANPFELKTLDYYTGQSVDDFIKTIRKVINNQQITYTGVAIEYLYQHDMSLEKSLEIAIKRGFSMKSLDSEVLATLLYQQDLRQQLAAIEIFIKDIFKQAEQLVD